MSYYDYDHFWAPHEVCGQKDKTVKHQKLLPRFKTLFIQIRNEFLADDKRKTETINNHSFQDRFDN